MEAKFASDFRQRGVRKRWSSVAHLAPTGPAYIIGTSPVKRNAEFKAVKQLRAVPTRSTPRHQSADAAEDVGAMSVAGTVERIRPGTRLLDSDGAARQLRGERVEQIVARRASLQGWLAELARSLGALEDARVEAGWGADCLAHFDQVWDSMTVQNKARLVRAVVDRVEVNAATGVVTAVLVDLAGEREADSAAAEATAPPMGAPATEVAA